MFTLDPITILIRALVLVTAMPVHECAHGLVAAKLGDPTARSAGRLTLNPFHHRQGIAAAAGFRNGGVVFVHHLSGGLPDQSGPGGV